MPGFIKDLSNNWQPIDKISINDGAWKDAKAAWTKDASGNWQQWYSSGIPNPTSTQINSSESRQTLQWNFPSNNTSVTNLNNYTFPANTPLGHYYLIVWNDYRTNNSSATASTTYRTRRVFSLQVVSQFDASARIATSENLPSISGRGNYERIAEVSIRNVTRNFVTTDVSPGSVADIQYHSNDQTIMVVPGDTIRISVVLQGPYTEYLNWTHNAYS